MQKIVTATPILLALQCRLHQEELDWVTCCGASTDSGARCPKVIYSVAHCCLVEAAVATRFRIHVQQVVTLRRVPSAARPLAVLALGIGVRTSGARLEVGPIGHGHGRMCLLLYGTLGMRSCAQQHDTYKFYKHLAL